MALSTSPTAALPWLFEALFADLALCFICIARYTMVTTTVAEPSNSPTAPIASQLTNSFSSFLATQKVIDDTADRGSPDQAMSNVCRGRLIPHGLNAVCILNMTSLRGSNSHRPYRVTSRANVSSPMTMEMRLRQDSGSGKTARRGTALEIFLESFSAI
jgi:hypothetical protein